MERTDAFHIRINFIRTDIFFRYLHTLHGNILKSHIAKLRQILIDAFFAGIGKRLLCGTQVACVKFVVLDQFSVTDDDFLSFLCGKWSDLYDTCHISAKINKGNAVPILKDPFWFHLLMQPDQNALYRNKRRRNRAGIFRGIYKRSIVNIYTGIVFFTVKETGMSARTICGDLKRSIGSDNLLTAV